MAYKLNSGIGLGVVLYDSSLRKEDASIGRAYEALSRKENCTEEQVVHYPVHGP